MKDKKKKIGVENNNSNNKKLNFKLNTQHTFIVFKQK